MRVVQENMCESNKWHENKQTDKEVREGGDLGLCFRPTETHSCNKSNPTWTQVHQLQTWVSICVCVCVSVCHSQSLLPRSLTSQILFSNSSFNIYVFGFINGIWSCWQVCFPHQCFLYDWLSRGFHNEKTALQLMRALQNTKRQAKPSKTPMLGITLHSELHHYSEYILLIFLYYNCLCWSFFSLDSQTRFKVFVANCEKNCSNNFGVVGIHSNSLCF